MAADLTLANGINNMLKPELRLFLLARGITVTDYNVSQLRELAIKTSDIKLTVILKKMTVSILLRSERRSTFKTEW